MWLSPVLRLSVKLSVGALVALEGDLAENGARINRDERRAFEALMTQITRVKSS